MAFKLKWMCIDCGTVIWAIEQPEDYECKCIIEEEKEEESNYNEKLMSKDEAAARYKEQYKLNGYTWNGEPGKMFYGTLDVYPDRSYLKEKSKRMFK